jgi:hypothetical protein
VAGSLEIAMNDAYVRPLLRQGRLRIGEQPTWRLSDEGLDELKSALRDQSLALAGPPIVGSLDALIPAIQVTYRFARRALHPEMSPVGSDASLKMPHPPRSAAEHLGADLPFRFLPGLYQRLVTRDPGDELAAALKNLLREWPLSGILADISEPPTSPLNFEGHLGVRFLYAERLVDRERPGWLPLVEESDELDLVCQTLGRPPIVRPEPPSPESESA